jgi:hypothetical protein
MTNFHLKKTCSFKGCREKPTNVMFIGKIPGSYCYDHYSIKLRQKWGF